MDPGRLDPPGERGICTGQEVLSRTAPGRAAQSAAHPVQEFRPTTRPTT